MYYFDRIIIFVVLMILAFTVSNFYHMTAWAQIPLFVLFGMASTAIGYKKKEDR